MALNYNKNVIGKFAVKENGSRFTIEMRECNALTCNIWINKKENYVQLYSFLADEQHCKNIMKSYNDIFMGANVVWIKLNMYYKQSWILLKYITRSGRKCLTYYEEPSKS